MPQSLAAIHLHLVFSTKDRKPYLKDPELRQDLHSFLGGVCKKLDCPPVQIGGVEDHVHVLARFGRNLTIADWVKESKRVTSLWLKEQDASLSQFHWQTGYGVFSVSESKVDTVIRYIQNQETHHHKMGFQDEMRKLYRSHKVEFDERYVWD